MFRDADGNEVTPSGGPRVNLTLEETRRVLAAPLEERQAMAVAVARERSRKMVGAKRNAVDQAARKSKRKSKRKAARKARRGK